MPWLVLAFGAGAAAVQLLPALPSVAALLAPALVAWLARRRHAATAALLLGFVWTALAATGRLAGDWPCARDREVVELDGIVAAPATRREERVEFDLRVARPRGALARPVTVRVSWYAAVALPLPGQRWRLSARLRCRNGLANDHAPDRELELLRQSISATGYVIADAAPVLVDDRPWRHPVERLRARVASGIAAALPASPAAAVLQGLSVGARGGVSEYLWEAFAATGVAHLMAISGLHVTGCALFALLLTRACWRLRWTANTRRRVAIEMIVVTAVTAAYALLAGGSLPALRTLAMVGIAAWQRVLRRALPVPATLALAALLLLAMDPLALTSPGFWLSFVATAALLALIDAGPGWRARVAGFLRAQAAILAALTPVLAVAFGRLSLIAPLANAIAIPVFSLFLLPVVLVATVLGALSAGHAAAIWRPLAGLLDATWPWLVTAGRWSGATWTPAAQPLVLLVAAGLAAFAALLVPARGLRVAAAAVLLAVMLGRTARPQENAWVLTVIDVGQGLAAVVQTRAHALVFDTGPRWRAGPAAARSSLLPWLRGAGIRRIDRLLVSHADMDHAGGAALLQATLPVGRIVTGPGVEIPGASSPCVRGDRWRWDGIEFRVLHPSAGAHGSDNDDSCALMVSGPGGRALLLADTEAAGERQLLAQSLAAEVVLVPHHGSRTSSSAALVAAIGARLAIVSAGFGNRWGMPDAAVVARWRAAGTSVLTTAQSGAVTARFAARPGGVSAAAYRLEHRRWWQRSPSR